LRFGFRGGWIHDRSFDCVFLTFDLPLLIGGWSLLVVIVALQAVGNGSNPDSIVT